MIAIGVLASFGVFNPSGSLPNVCTIGAPLGCDEHQVIGKTQIDPIHDGQIRLRIKNGAGTTVTITKIDIVGCVADHVPSFDGGDNTFPGGSIGDVTITCDLEPGLSMVTKDRFSGDLTVTYTKSDDVISSTASGSISSEAV